MKCFELKMIKYTKTPSIGQTHYLEQ